MRVSGPLHSNGGALVVAAAIAGMGVIFEPDFAVKPALDAGLLTRVLSEYERANRYLGGLSQPPASVCQGPTIRGASCPSIRRAGGLSPGQQTGSSVRGPTGRRLSHLYLT